MTRDSEKHFSVLLIFLLLSLLILPVSASSASTTAQQINSLLDKKTPYTIEMTTAQMTAAGFDAFNLTHNKSVFKLTAKSASYNAKTETLDLYLNAWIDGNSIKINNPVHLVMPFEGGIHGANANAKLQNFIFMMVVYVDGKPYGQPVNDDTSLIYAHTDAYVSQVATNTSWGVLKSAAGNAVTANATGVQYLTRSMAATFDPNMNRLVRGGITFNTSTLIGKTISSGKLRTKYYGKAVTYGGTMEIAIVPGSPASNDTWVAGDYDSYGTTELTSRYDFSAAAAGDINFTLNAAGLALIGGNNYARFMFVDGDELDGTFSGTWGSGVERSLYIYGANYATQANIPYLEVIWSDGGDTIPPASITGLANGTFSCPTQSVDLSWTNPADPDYYRLNAYINGTLTYYSNATTSVTLSGLPESSTITFDTRTEDLAGNLDTDWVNTSILTGSCATPTPTTPPPTTATPTPTPMTGCSFVNTTAESIRANSTSWSIVLGNISWGVLIENVTQGNLSHWSCIGTPTPPPTTITTIPIIPNLPAPGSTDWKDWFISLWWLWLLIIAFLVLARW